LDKFYSLFYGAVEATTNAPLALIVYHHVIINLFENYANSNLDEFRSLYQKGLSLREVSAESGYPVSTIRDVLVLNQVPLRANTKAKENTPTRPQRAFRGAIPYGYSILDGRIAPYVREHCSLKLEIKTFLNHVIFTWIGIKLA